MTRLQILSRLYDIVDNSNAEDAVELLAYCDAEIRKISQIKMTDRAKLRKQQEQDEHNRLCVWEVLKERPNKFLPVTYIVRRLNQKFTYKTWTYPEIRGICPALVKEHKVEKLEMRFPDIDNPKITRSGPAYRIIEGAKL